MTDKTPVTREEYENHLKETHGYYERYARRSTRILVALVLVSLFTSITSAWLLRENAKRSNENAEQTAEIEKTLVRSCEESGNPLRLVVRELARVQIEEIMSDLEQGKALERSGAYEEIFPSYPAGKLHQLLQESRERDRKTTKGLKAAQHRAAPVDCEAKFAR